MEKEISLSRFTAMSPEVRKEQPEAQLRPRAEIEKHPAWSHVQAEKDGRSNWSGGVFGGRVDRSR
jgi:hypothetical protein